MGVCVRTRACVCARLCRHLLSLIGLPVAEPTGDRAGSICSRRRSNDALMPYAKSPHLLSLLTFVANGS